MADGNGRGEGVTVVGARVRSTVRVADVGGGVRFRGCADRGLCGCGRRPVSMGLSVGCGVSVGDRTYRAATTGDSRGLGWRSDSGVGQSNDPSII